MLQTKVVVKIKTHFLCSINCFFFRKSCRYEIMWKNTAEPDRPQMKILRMHMYLRLQTNTHTHTHTHNRTFLL